MSRYDQTEWNAKNIINSPFDGLGRMTPEREAYSSQRVVETVEADSEGNLQLAWAPVVKAEVKKEDSEGVKWEVVEVDKDGKILSDNVASGDVVRYVYDNVYIPQKKLPSVVARMSGIPLTARVRKLAIEYDTLGAFQA